MTAGLKADCVRHAASLGTFDDAKPHKMDSSVPSTTYAAELFVLDSRCEPADALEVNWLEQDERERKWVQGWDELTRHVVWGRRQDVLTAVIARTREALETTATVASLQ